MMLIRIYRSAYLQEVFREAEHWQVYVHCNRFQSIVEQMYESQMKSTENSSHELLEGTGSKKSLHVVPKSMFPDPEHLVRIRIPGSRTFRTYQDPRIQNSKI
jgi:hypothetical protein